MNSKLAHIKQRVDDGTYTVDPALVAESILTHRKHDAVTQVDRRAARSSTAPSFCNPRELFYTFLPHRSY